MGKGNHTYRKTSNLVRQKNNYFGHAALIIRGDKISTFYHFEAALINRGNSDQNRIELGVCLQRKFHKKFRTPSKKIRKLLL